MHSKIAGLLLSATCAGVLALTLTAAAAATPATSGASAAVPSSATTTASLSTEYVIYRNTEWHFALAAPSNLTVDTTNIPGGVVLQFMAPDGEQLFQVSAWRYQDLVVHADGLQLLPASTDADQGDELDTVHSYDGDLLQLAFEKNGIGYNVQTSEPYATTTLDIIKSWHFI